MHTIEAAINELAADIRNSGEAANNTAAALSRIEALLTDIRALLLYQTTAPGLAFDKSMAEIRDLTSKVTAR